MVHVLHLMNSKRPGGCTSPTTEAHPKAAGSPRACSDCRPADSPGTVCPRAKGFGWYAISPRGLSAIVFSRDGMYARTCPYCTTYRPGPPRRCASSRRIAPHGLLPGGSPCTSVHTSGLRGRVLATQAATGAVAPVKPMCARDSSVSEGVFCQRDDGGARLSGYLRSVFSAVIFFSLGKERRSSTYGGTSCRRSRNLKS